jgi:thiamine transporter ThiT
VHSAGLEPASVQKSLKISTISLVSYRRGPPLFVWVGVLIGVFKLTTGAELPRALSSVAEDYSL